MCAMNVLVFGHVSKEDADEQEEKATERHIHPEMRLDFVGRLVTKSAD